MILFLPEIVLMYSNSLTNSVSSLTHSPLTVPSYVLKYINLFLRLSSKFISGVTIVLKSFGDF